MELFITAVIIVIGTLLLVAEVAFIPGFGITGFMGISAMLGAIVYAFQAIGHVAGWITIAIIILIITTLILWAIYGKSLDKIALKKNIDSTVADDAISEVKVGDKGCAITRLALIGEAQFGDNIIEVTSCDGFIDEKEEISVKRISAGVIYVAKS
jgi:membrane-bound ClpP family serine protease